MSIPRARRTPLAALLVVLVITAGCGRDPQPGPYTADAGLHRDVAAADRLYREAVAVIDDDPEAGEALLRAALGHDLFHGPAHNNLGVLFLRRDRLYEAASEFEWARKLLPGHPDPRVNLAMALERGGKHGDALTACHAALQVQPGYLPAIQTAAYIRLRHDLHDDPASDSADILARLAEIESRSGDPTWRDWAKRWRLRLTADG
ncbi:MAG: hypothetical protein ACLFP0_07875 [Rhodosalinus sp.]